MSEKGMMDVNQPAVPAPSQTKAALPRKLHLGCGDHILSGWVNTDHEPRDRRVHHLDVTKPFPIKSASFDLIFTEHMIEHLSYEDGKRMLAECHRILRPGGRMRITTPDLRFLIALFDQKPDALQTSYLAWASSVFCGGTVNDHPVFVLNNFVRAWGHKFIYDPSCLRNLMVHVGFSEIQENDLMTSDHEEFRNLENVTRLPSGYLQLESFTLEGRRPS